MYPKPARALGKKPQKHEHRAGFPGALGEGSWGSQISNFCGCFVIVKKHGGGGGVGWGRGHIFTINGCWTLMKEKNIYIKFRS